MKSVNIEIVELARRAAVDQLWRQTSQEVRDGVWDNIRIHTDEIHTAEYEIELEINQRYLTNQ